MRRNPTSLAKGFSLAEAITTIAIIGILAAIAIPTIGKVTEGSRRGVARNIVETLNKATKEFGHSQYDLRVTPNPATGADDMLILRTLQWRDPNPSGELNFPGPFMRTDWNPIASSSSQDYRVEWTGSSWQLLEPGTAGSGLKIDFEGTDLGTPYVHAGDFKPIGSK